MANTIQINGTDYRMRENGAVVASTSGTEYLPVYNRYGTPVRVVDEDAFAEFVHSREEREAKLRANNP